MAKYRRKSKVIEAFQYDGDFVNSKGEYYVPDWAVNALHNGILYYGSETPDTPPCSLYCRTVDGFVIEVKVGYYIVKLPDGNIATCSEEYINEQYELVNE